MITITRVKQAATEFIKVLRFGKDDIQTAEPILPFGIDSKPVKDLLGVHADTMDEEASVVLGYILHSETTSEGETRIYATDTDGTEVFDIYLKNDGTCEFGGNVDFFIRYNALNTALQTFVTDLNTKLSAAFTALGGTWPGTSLDISDSKIDNIKSP